MVSYSEDIENAVMAPALSMRRTLGRNVSHARWNYRLGIAEGAFGGIANDLLHPELILAGFVYAATGSAFAVALVTVIHKFGIMLPQFIAGNMVEPFARRRPIYAAAAAMRLVSAIMMGASIVLSARFTGTAVIVFFFTAVFAHALAKGVMNILRSDMIGRLIPSHRVGALLGVRKFLGGTTAILAGAIIIQPILNTWTLPYNYFLIVSIGVFIMFLGAGSWCICREEPGYRAKDRASLTDAVRRGIGWLKNDWNYRCYLWIRVSFRFSYVGMAFFIPYGSESLRYGAEAGGLAVLGGVLVAVKKVSDLASSLLWARIADVRGYRAALLYSSIVTAAAPILAVVAGGLPGFFELHIPGIAYPVNLPLLVFLLALACLGAGFSGLGLAGQQFLITNAPPEHRPSYLAFINTLITPLTLLPLAGAVLARALGMDMLFAMVAAGSCLGVLGAARMREPAG